MCVSILYRVSVAIVEQNGRNVLIDLAMLGQRTGWTPAKQADAEIQVLAFLLDKNININLVIYNPVVCRGLCFSVLLSESRSLCACAA